MQHIKRCAFGLMSVALLLVAAAPAAGQITPYGQAKVPPKPAAPEVLNKVGIDQKLDAQVPLDLTFKDEAGQTVKLGQYFKGKPVVLSLVYYQCPMLCTMVLNGELKSFRPLSLDIGKDFEVVTVSFDPREGPELAAAKKQAYLKQYNRPGAEDAWHFLTGDEENIRKLAEAVGFRYTWDEASKQYAHGAALMVLTPHGRMSRYLYGLEYAPRDVRWALIEAAENKIGSVVDQILLLCYHYDPANGKYGFVVSSALRIGGVLTMALLGGFMLVMFRRDRAKGAVKPMADDGEMPGSVG